MKAPAKKKTTPVKSVKKPAPKPAAKQKAPAKKAPTSQVATGKAGRLATVRPAKLPTKKAKATTRPAAKPAARSAAKPGAKPAAKPPVKPPAKPAVKVVVPSTKPIVAGKKDLRATKPIILKTVATAKPSATKSAAVNAPGTTDKLAAKPVQPAAKTPVAAVSKPVIRKPVAAAPRPSAKSVDRPAARAPQALVELPAMAKPAKKKKLTLEIPALLLEGDHAPGAHPGGPGSRYALGLAPLPEAETSDELTLPEAYGTKRIWLVPRDPQWLYAHWDFDDAQQREYNQLSRDGHLTLRVYDAAEVAEARTEIHVHPESRSWFAHVGKGGGRYFAVLGFRDRTGEWNEITRSGPVGTPPDSLSEAVEAEFMTLPYAVAATPAAEVILERPTPLPQPTAALPPEPPLELPPLATVAEVIEVVREYLAGETALAEAIEEVRATGQPPGPAPIDLPPPSEFVHWTAEQQQALARVISMDAVRQVWAGSHPSSVSLAPIAAEQRQKDLASAAAIPALEAGAPTGPGGGAISSPPGGLPRERSFWFNVNAELIIYGATEPNATVIIGDRPIKLRKDGTFSYRFALPDGLYGLPVSATSADRVETRYASLKFMRETEYGGEVGTHPQDAALKPPGPEHAA